MCDKINTCKGTERITNCDGKRVTRQCPCSAWALRKKLQHPFNTLGEKADAYAKVMAENTNMVTRSRVKSLYDKEFTAEDRALAKFYGLDIPELKL